MSVFEDSGLRMWLNLNDNLAFNAIIRLQSVYPFPFMTCHIVYRIQRELLPCLVPVRNELRIFTSHK